jgi:hypothetical protein
MNKKSDIQKASLQFRGPALYKIVVKGNLSANTDAWQDIQQTIALTFNNFEEESNSSSLMVHVSDQAELAGVFNTLYELHIAIRDVEYLGSNENINNTNLN